MVSTIGYSVHKSTKIILYSNSRKFIVYKKNIIVVHAIKFRLNLYCTAEIKYKKVHFVSVNNLNYLGHYK